MELFTFLRMGGALQRIRVVELGEGAEVSASLAKFDASKAQCYLTQDRERLLGVIEAGFGTLSAFDATIRHTFKGRKGSISTRRASLDDQPAPLRRAQTQPATLLAEDAQPAMAV